MYLHFFYLVLEDDTTCDDAQTWNGFSRAVWTQSKLKVRQISRYIDWTTWNSLLMITKEQFTIFRYLFDAVNHFKIATLKRIPLCHFLLFCASF